MQELELINLVEKVQKFKSEFQNIELKSANIGCPTKLHNTLSSFSNQDCGGIIIFGINEKDDYEICGVYDSHDLMKKVVEQCKEMEPVVRPLFTVCNIKGKTIVSAEIPAVDISLRPVFYKGVGRIKGSYIRVGESDSLMTEYEVYSYDAFRKRIHDELRLVENANLSNFDNELINTYIKNVRKNRKNFTNNVSNNEILELMGITKNNIPTLVGTLVFSKYPQTYFPQLCITAVSLPGLEMGELGSDNERFIDNMRITGSIPEIIEEATNFVEKNCRTKVIIDENGKRTDKLEYPIIAIREAILNAIVHRDYSIYTENSPIRIEMYRDRIEIINSGELYGRSTVESLGINNTETRNPVLANILEILKITENRYSGIPTMRKECIKNNLLEPIFISKRGQFKVIIKNSYEKSFSSNKLDIINYCQTPRSRNELISFIGKSRNYVMKEVIAPLLEQGLIEMTIPDKPKSSNQKYVKVKKEF